MKPDCIICTAPNHTLNYYGTTASSNSASLSEKEKRKIKRLAYVGLTLLAIPLILSIFVFDNIFLKTIAFLFSSLNFYTYGVVANGFITKKVYGAEVDPYIEKMIETMENEKLELGQLLLAFLMLDIIAFILLFIVSLFL